MVYLTPKEALQKITPIKEGIVLEIGFGNGTFLKWLCENKGENHTIVGIDIANLAFEKARSRLKECDVFLIKSEARFFFKNI